MLISRRGRACELCHCFLNAHFVQNIVVFTSKRKLTRVYEVGAVAVILEAEGIQTEKVWETLLKGLGLIFCLS